MLLLLFVHFFSARALPVPAVNDVAAPNSCKNIDDCRTLSGIVWSCFTTIFLCTWVSIHPNIPEPVDTRNMSFWHQCAHKISCLIRDRLSLFICAMLVPEYILAWAIRQLIVARRITKENANLGLTRTHGFFIIMGGFHYFKVSSNHEGTAYEMTAYEAQPMLQGTSNRSDTTISDEVAVHPLTQEDVIEMVKASQIRLPTKGEIQDRSKSDWLAKTLVLIQTLWFMVQYIARRIENLPTTELETVTLAYTAINFGIFVAWWDKPCNVECPIPVFHKPSKLDTGLDSSKWTIFHIILGLQDVFVDLHERRKVPRLYSGKPNDTDALNSDGIVVAAGLVFGAIHCIAWSFEFPSHTEELLWRLSSVAITAIPVLFALTYSIALQIGIDGYRPMPPFVLLYVAARVTTLVLAFMNLSSLPPGAFQAVHWTTLIPRL